MSRCYPNDPEERLSSEFDSGSVSDELLDKVGREQAAELTKAWQLLGDSFRAIPVRDSSDLHAAVMAQLRSDRIPTAAMRSTETKGSRTPQWAALLTSVAAVLFVCVSWMSQPDRSVLRVAGSSLAQLGADVASLPGDWEVMVVTMPNDGSEGIPESVRRSADSRGLQLHSLSDSSAAGEDHPDVLMASGNLSSTLRGVLESEPDDFEIEMNPSQIGDLSRGELLSRFAESMKTPTRSDEYFGEMFVVLSHDDDIIVKSVPTGTSLKEFVVADAKAAAIPSSPVANGTDSRRGREMANGIDRAIRDHIKQGDGRPVLVVFVKRKPAPPNLRSDLDVLHRLSIGV